MKKNIVFILIPVVMLVASCKEDNKMDFFDFGTEIHVSGKMTSLDNQLVLSIENPLKNMSTTTVTHVGIHEPDTPDEELIDPPSTNLGNITIADGAGAITLTDTQLGISEIGWTANIELDSEFQGTPFKRYFHVTVTDPISTEDPEITHRNDTSYHFKYSIKPIAATVAVVTIQTKVSHGGTYTDLAGTWNAIDSIAYMGSDYNMGDTIYVKVIGTSGTKTATTVTKLAINPIGYKNKNKFKLDNTANQAYDFMKARLVNTTMAGDTADIELSSALISGGYNLGFVSNNNAVFVLASSFDYSNADMLQITTTDFSMPLTSVPSLVGGEVYIYRTRRGVEAYSYGIMKVAAVVKPGGVLADSYIELEFKN